MTVVYVLLSIIALITLRFVLRWSILYPETLWDWSKEDVESIYTAEW